MSITLKGLERVEKALDKAAIKTGSQRKKIMRSIGRKVISNSKKRTTRQVDVKGIPFKKHARGRKRKMIVRLARKLKVVDISDDQATIGFFNSFHSSIAAKQQFGHTQAFTASQFKANGKLDTKGPATRRQAKALKEAGYKVKIKSRGYRTPSIKWITENLNIGKAGVIIRALRGKKQAWKTKLPARAFLGTTDAELNQITEQTIAEVQTTLE